MNGAQMMHNPIILLKQGTEATSGKGLILSNIRGCLQIVDTMKTTLGPRGQDKLFKVQRGTHITNDGATIISLLNVVHPAVKTLVDVSQAQDSEAGDGTTSVVLIAGGFLEEARKFIEDGVHPQLVVAGYKKASQLALEEIKRIAVNLSTLSPQEKENVIRRCAETSLNSKLLANHRELFGQIVYDAVSQLGTVMDKEMISIKKISGGSVTESELIHGVAFQKTFSYAGFENAPKQFTNPKILLLNLELELKAEKENAEIRVDDVKTFQKMIDSEWQIIFDKLDLIVAAGAQIVLSRLAIGDLATQYLADRGVFCAGRVEEKDMKRLARSCGTKVLTTVSKITAEDLGTCGNFEEKQIGKERYNVFSKCPEQGPTTIILRGGAHQFIDEAERSLNDAIMTCRRAFQSSAVVGGGGAVEMAVSAYLRDHARTIPGKMQLIIAAYARALECIPRTLAANSGLDPTDVLNRLRQLHHSRDETHRWMGVDCMTESPDGVMDTVKNFVWEPITVRLNAFASATEAACAILSVDEMVKNPPSNPAPNGPGVGGRGRTVRK